MEGVCQLRKKPQQTQIISRAFKKTSRKSTFHWNPIWTVILDYMSYTKSKSSLRKYGISFQQFSTNVSLITIPNLRLAPKWEFSWNKMWYFDWTVIRRSNFCDAITIGISNMRTIISPLLLICIRIAEYQT